jgi:hypothetical protein
LAHPAAVFPAKNRGVDDHLSRAIEVGCSDPAIQDTSSLPVCKRIRYKRRNLHGQGENSLKHGRSGKDLRGHLRLMIAFRRLDRQALQHTLAGCLMLPVGQVQHESGSERAGTVDIILQRALQAHEVIKNQ